MGRTLFREPHNLIKDCFSFTFLPHGNIRSMTILFIRCQFGNLASYQNGKAALQKAPRKAWIRNASNKWLVSALVMK
jgi:hypothetical protein